MPDPVPEKKPVHCDHCGAYLCGRSGNTVFIGDLEIELKRSHNIRCARCRRHTRFGIDRNEQKGVTSI